MASPRRVADHFRQAEHNEDLLSYLLEHVLPQEPRFLDWFFTVAFYAAVHRINAVLLRDHNVDPGGHKTFRDADTGEVRKGRLDLAAELLPEEAAKALFHLHSLSRQARYTPLHATTRGKDDALNQARLTLVSLGFVQQYCHP